MATALASSTSSSSRCAVGSMGRKQQQRAGRRAPMAPRAGPSVRSVRRRIPFACFFFSHRKPSSLAPGDASFSQSPCSGRRILVASLDRGSQNEENESILARIELSYSVVESGEIALSEERRYPLPSFFLLSQPRPLSFLSFPLPKTHKQKTQNSRGRDRGAAPRARLLLRLQRAPHRRPRLPPLPDQDGPLRPQPGQRRRVARADGGARRRLLEHGARRADAEAGEREHVEAGQPDRDAGAGLR